MIRILLLDDSLTIQKVVKLTFAANPPCEVKAAKTLREAADIVAQFRPDVVIAYVRFTGESEPMALVEVRAVCPAILLLTESNENLEPFEAAGFRNFLRKPFHSEELRQAVQALLPQDLQTSQFDHAEFNEMEEPTHALNAPVAFSMGPKPPLPSPPSLPSLASSSSFQAPPNLSASQHTQPQAFRATVRASSAPPSNPFQAGLKPQEALTPAEPVSLNIPQITMDIESLERSYRATLSQRDRSAEASTASVFLGGTHEDSLVFSSEPTASGLGQLPGGNVAGTRSGSSSSGMASAGVSFGQGGLTRPPPPPPVRMQAIEIADLGHDVPLELEDVVVNPPRSQAPRAQSNGAQPQSVGVGSSESSPGLSKEALRAELGVMVDEALMRALERAVPAKIEQKLNLEWDAFVRDVSERLKADVLAVVKDSMALEAQGMSRGVLADLKASLQPQFRTELERWLARESVDLAKDIVREEIRKLLEDH